MNISTQSGQVPTTGIAALDELTETSPGTLTLFLTTISGGINCAIRGHILATAQRLRDASAQRKVLVISRDLVDIFEKSLELGGRNRHLRDFVVCVQATSLGALTVELLNAVATKDDWALVSVANLGLVVETDTGRRAAAAALRKTANEGLCVWSYLTTRSLPDDLLFYKEGMELSLFSVGEPVQENDFRLPLPGDVRGGDDIFSNCDSVVGLHRSVIVRNPLVGGHLRDTRARAISWKARHRQGASIQLRFDANPSGRSGAYLSAN